MAKKEISIESLLKENGNEKYKVNHLCPINEAFDGSKPIMVSIVCNCFNHQDHIGKCLEGFLMQHVDFNVEVLIHDDASTDRSQAIIKEYEQRYPNVIKPIYQKENQYSQKVNVSSTFQYPRANGKYLAFCEGDDYWFDPNKLFIQVSFLESHPEYLMCVHDTIIFDCRENRFIRKYADYGEDTDIPVSDAIVWGPRHKAHVSSWLVHREGVLCEKPKFVSSYAGVGDQPLLTYFTLKGKVIFLNLTMSTYNMFSCPTSWRVRNYSNSETTSQLLSNRIVFFETLKSEIGPEYYSLIDNLILKDRFSILINKKDYKKIYSKEYKQAYRSLSVLTRIKLLIKYIISFFKHEQHK